MRKIFFALAAIIPLFAQSQTDTTTHGWPLAPFFGSHPITGVFSEFRNTLTSDHFHNGDDIPSPDGSPAYPVYDGLVTAIGTVASQGNNAYVRVAYNVSGLSKSDAYVHIAPNPLLIVGDSVYAQQTVLGTILPGLGHVHFTHGTSPGYMNGIRPVGGLTPYIDIYPPAIQSVRFFVDQTETEFLQGRVSGLVDIRVHVRETNASNPGEITGSTSNNGTYIIGYKILSADTSMIMYEPPSAGVRFRFDRKPGDSYVHNVFATGSDVSTHIYTITNGPGADLVNATLVVGNNAWDTGALPVDDYLVMIFTEDTRSNAETLYVPIHVDREDVIAPAPPELRSVVNDSTGKITVSWVGNTEGDLRGYRLYFSADGTTWILKDGESVLTAGMTEKSYYNVFSTGAIYFRLAAVDSASIPNVSGFSDFYGVRLNSSSTSILIVDGFDRTEPSGSYHETFHPFAMTYGRSVPFDFNTCSNDAILNSSVSLPDYDVVLWVLGDESSNDETFSAAEQAFVKAYLQNGGRLFVSGSEIGYDLDRPSGPTQEDRDFLHDFLKTRYAGDDSNEYTVVGEPSSIFGDVNLRYGIVAEGSPYDEDWPDYLTPEPGASVLLRYGNATSSVYAGTGYKGLFPNGTAPGAVAVVGFPFETITTKANRDTVMRRVFQYFDYLTDVAEGDKENLPFRFALAQNYPNPFNPSTTIVFQVPQEILVDIKVYDVLGREVTTLVQEVVKPGNHSIRWNASGIASGMYFYRMRAGGFSTVHSMMVLK